MLYVCVWHTMTSYYVKASLFNASHIFHKILNFTFIKQTTAKKKKKIENKVLKLPAAMAI